jgi:hypothetical protein
VTLQILFLRVVPSSPSQKAVNDSGVGKFSRLRFKDLSGWRSLEHNHQKVAAERSLLSLNLGALRVSASELASCVGQSCGGTISTLSLYRHSAPPPASRATSAVNVTSFLSQTSSGSLQVSSPRRSSIRRGRETKDASGSVICAVACSRLRVPDVKAAKPGCS